MPENFSGRSPVQSPAGLRSSGPGRGETGDPFSPVPGAGRTGDPFSPVPGAGRAGDPFSPVPGAGGAGDPFSPVPSAGGTGDPFSSSPCAFYPVLREGCERQSCATREPVKASLCYENAFKGNPVLREGL